MLEQPAQITDIKQSVIAESGDDIPQQQDEFWEEDAAIEAFIEQRLTRFVLGSRDKIETKVFEYLLSASARGYVSLIGEAGAGKSALLAHAVRCMTLGQQRSALVIAHFVGAGVRSTDVRCTLRRLCHKLGSRTTQADTEGELKKSLHDALRIASGAQHVIIVIDGVNQFPSLSWLPKELPQSVRFLISTTPGATVDVLRRVAAPLHEIELPRLEAKDAVAIVTTFLQRYAKTMTAAQQSELLRKNDAGNPLFLVTALEELRTLGAYEEITRRIRVLPSDTLGLLKWVFARLERDQGFRDASGKPAGQLLVSTVASLICASRHGVSERALTEMIGSESLEQNATGVSRNDLGMHLTPPGTKPSGL